jgi:hypothetical protein
MKYRSLLAAILIAAATATPVLASDWHPCSTIREDRVTEGTFSAPRWAVKQKGSDFGIAGISNHGLCNQKLHKVVICNPLNDDNDPVCGE